MGQPVHVIPEERDYQASIEMLLEDITLKVQRRRIIVDGRGAGLSHVEVAREIAGLAHSLHYMAQAAAIVGKP